MTSIDEYLERLFAEGLKREIDSDESVWRTLPFFATTIGITGTILGYDGALLPSFAWAVRPLTAYLLFAMSGASLFAAFAWMFIAFRPRTYRYPPAETDIQQLAIEYSDYHRALGEVGSPLEAAVVSSIRTIMVEEYALAAVQNRRHNRRRLFARSQAIFFLMIGLAISFAFGAFSFVETRVVDPTVAQFAGASVDRAAKAYRLEAVACLRADAAPASAAAIGVRGHSSVRVTPEDAKPDLTRSDISRLPSVDAPAAVRPVKPMPTATARSLERSRD